MKKVRNIKTVILLTILAMMLMTPAGVFAGGNTEQAETVAPDKLEVENYEGLSISYDLKGNTNNIIMQMTDQFAKYGVLRTEDKDGNTIYKELNSGETLSTTSNAIWSSIFSGAGTPVSVTFSDDMTEKFCNVTDPKVITGSYSSSITAENLDYFKITNSGRLVISYDTYGLAKEYDIVVVNSDLDKYYRYQFNLSQEYFPGEYELFSEPSVSSISYEKKAVAALGLVCGDDFISAYSSLGLDTAMTSSDWDMFESIFAETGTDAINEGVIKDSLRRSMRSHFESGVIEEDDEAYPYVISEAMFDGIYRDEPNIYLKTYLTYIYENDKPVFSQLYTDIFQNTGVGYNWTNYTPMDQTTGLEYAKNALRYYTWGVEYTPFEGYGYNLYSREMNEVWDRIQNNSSLLGWVNGTVEGSGKTTI